jgi:hypothetical protein
LKELNSGNRRRCSQRERAQQRLVSTEQRHCYRKIGLIGEQRGPDDSQEL